MIFFEIKSNIGRSKNFIKFIRFVFILLLFLNYYFNNKIRSYATNLNYIKECNKIEEYLKLCNNKLIFIGPRINFVDLKELITSIPGIIEQKLVLIKFWMRNDNIFL